jgi:plasmid stabilization system protein ParE
MHTVIFTPETKAQLGKLFAYIAEASSSEIAANYTQDIVSLCEGLATFPLRGTSRDDLRPGMRTLGYKRRVTIVFEVTESLVTIIGIFYGGRSFEANS